jgi:hypothetical protein
MEQPAALAVVVMVDMQFLHLTELVVAELQTKATLEVMVLYQVVLTVQVAVVAQEPLEVQFLEQPLVREALVLRHP